MANPAVPRASNDSTGVPLLYGIHDIASADEPALYRIVNAAVVDDETTKSGAIAIAALTLHDGADPTAEGPIKIGGRAQIPTSDPDEVADNDRVDALFDRNGRLAVTAHQIPKTAVINAASSGDNTLVAAVAGKRIAVWAFWVQGEAAVSVRFEDGAAGTAKTGVVDLASTESVFSASSGGLVPLWVGTSNTLLNLELSGPTQTNGFVSYTEWDD